MSTDVAVPELVTMPTEGELVTVETLDASNLGQLVAIHTDAAVYFGYLHTLMLAESGRAYLTLERGAAKSQPILKFGETVLLAQDRREKS